jgi:mRNA interferase RelE/StbE
MRFEIILAPQAIEGLRAVRPDFQQGVREVIELHLRHEPTKLSRSRIKRLRGLDRPQYRLRVNEIRVFYDVTEETVEVLAIVSKQQAEAWLAEEGVPATPGGAGEDEG